MSSINKRLRAAAGYGNEAELKELLRDPSCNALNADEMGMTALMWAAYHGHEAFVRILMPVSDARAKNENGQTILMWAACHEHAACVRLLLPASDAQAKNKSGQTALMYAACHGSDSCVRLLLPVSDVLAKDQDGWTAHCWAKESGHKNLAQFLKAYELSQNEHAIIEGAASPSTPRKRAARRV